MKRMQGFGGLLALGLWATACVVPKLDKVGPSGGQDPGNGLGGSADGGSSAAVKGGARDTEDGDAASAQDGSSPPATGGGPSQGGAPTAGHAGAVGVQDEDAGPASGGGADPAVSQSGGGGRSPEDATALGGTGNGEATGGLGAAEPSAGAAGVSRCEQGRTRSCVEGGWVGACASGIQVCGSDGSWSACSIQPKDADTCVEANDDDCDGSPNGGCACVEGRRQPCGDSPDQGICQRGESLCTSGSWGECVGVVYPGHRDCRSSGDNDCNGEPDDTEEASCQCEAGTTRPCDEHPGQDGLGICRAGTETCVVSTDGTESYYDGDCLGSVGPSEDTCEDDLDEDCDGIINNGCPCPDGLGPPMVRLVDPYCIDSTEVTRDQYQAWLSQDPIPDPADQDPTSCGWNGSFEPSCEWPPGDKGDYPVVCVDWCDAFAFCRAAGKRLCGKMGGGPSEYMVYTNADHNQWFNACSSHGQHAYPYGNSYVAGACNGVDSGGGTIMATGSLETCQPSSDYAGVFDLSGNADEWEDSCSGPDDRASCRLRGGYFRFSDDAIACDVDAATGRRNNYDFIGFRCCAF